MIPTNLFSPKGEISGTACQSERPISAGCLSSGSGAFPRAFRIAPFTADEWFAVGASVFLPIAICRFGRARSFGVNFAVSGRCLKA